MGNNKTNKSSIYPRGSEWRRWDLHVHTPESHLGSPFGNTSWDEYVTALEVASTAEKVAVIGITDYMTIDGYEKLLFEKESNGRLASTTLLIPNIEFRMMPQTDDGKALNLHLLVDPSQPDHIDRIKRSLRNLKFDYDGESYGCCKEELIEFGKAQDPSLIDEEDSAYKFGIRQFKPDRTVIKTWLDKEKWLKNNSLVGIANGKDGISGLPLDGFGATRDEILKWCDFVFSGNPSDRKHYLGLKSSTPPKEIIRQYKSLKPCIHGSDAHDVGSLFKPDMGRYTWIKANPTFSGLKQTLCEPEGRVRIQTESPDEKINYEVIDKVRFIDKSKENFSNAWISINSGLNSIIGGKSSGKSLLLYHIAKTIDPKGTAQSIGSGDKSIKYSYKSDIDFEVQWADGKISRLSDDSRISDRPITFIPQLYLNALAENRESADFRRVIEGVLKEDEGYASFISTKYDEVGLKKAEIHSSVSSYLSLDQKIKAEKESLQKLGDKKAVESSISIYKGTIEVLKKESAFSEEEVNQYNSLIANKEKLLKSLDEAKRKKSLFDDLSGTLERLPESIKQLIFDQEFEQVKNKYLSSNEALETIQGLSIKLQKGLTNSINSVRDDYSANQPKHGKNIVTLGSEIQELDKLLIPFAAKFKNKEKFELTNKQLKQEETKLGAIVGKQKEIEAMTISLKKVLLSNKYQELIDLYQEIVTKNKEHDEIDKTNEISLVTEITFDNQRFSENFLKRIRKSSPLRTQFGKMFNDGNEYQFTLEEHLGNIQNIFVNIFQKQNVILNVGSTLDDVLHALLDDYFVIEYDLLQKGDRLLEMSPGKRGIILFQLFLQLSHSKTPILIDQPEDNLDNRTVYQELNEFIKEKKLQRQIIIVSHNANLVVSTDSEEVIVANQSGQKKGAENAEYKFEYISGSLENSFIDTSASGILHKKGIREHVCEVLEGGLEAFKKRELQYASIQ